MRNGDAKIFALRVIDAKIFLTENWRCKTDVKFFALSFGDAKIFALAFLPYEVLCFPLFWTSLVFDHQKLN